MDAASAAARFNEDFARLYRRFYRRLSLGDYRLTNESLAIVQHLAGAGPLTVTEAARHMQRSQAAMSEQIARLVERGLLDRMADERDRRRTLIWLTDTGREVLAEANTVLAPDRLTAAFAQLLPAEREKLISTLERLLESPEPNRREPS